MAEQVVNHVHLVVGGIIPKIWFLAFVVALIYQTNGATSVRLVEDVVSRDLAEVDELHPWLFLSDYCTGNWRHLVGLGLVALRMRR